MSFYNEKFNKKASFEDFIVRKVKLEKNRKMAFFCENRDGKTAKIVTGKPPASAADGL